MKVSINLTMKEMCLSLISKPDNYGEVQLQKFKKRT